MRYPALIVNREKVLENARTVEKLCRSNGIAVWGVTKGLSGDPRLASIFADAGFKGIADSRLRNLKKIKDSGCGLPLQLMRIAMRSEQEELVGIAGISLQSEVTTIMALDEICVRLGTTHEVLLMVDVGDLREGFWPDELPASAELLRELKGGVRLSGVAANFACASGVLPTSENMTALARYRDTAAGITGMELPTISVGGTCCLDVIERGQAPREVNALRLCEGVMLGMDTAFNRKIPYLSRDALRITAEIVECKLKPSVPVGTVGLQAFGEKPVFSDRGVRKRALLGIGRQDVNIDRIEPIEDGVEIVTASSDHLIIDMTDADCGVGCEPGDTLSFRPLYPAMLACSTSEYVELVFE
ncbi:MAG: alanine/ornithine racemase family PLP-dependent enzyme [Synergistaceae bacterium]|jgi:predicted amino acid racemase|nr:alanine/ornithine racemase family PLP-dependent enzyme [Synergistaceae bacterium]